MPQPKFLSKNMATTRFFLDCRYKLQSGTAALKIVITHNGSSAMLPVGFKIFPNQWDSDNERVVNHPDRLSLTRLANKLRFDVDDFLLTMEEKKKLNKCSAMQLRDIFLGKGIACDNFVEYFMKFMNRKSGGTLKVYKYTLSRLEAYCSDLSSLSFDDVDVQWLTSFDSWLTDMQHMSVNARSVVLRCIRAVFNAAITDELTSAYPFRRFKIKSMQTRKRSLTVEQLRLLFTCEVQPYVEYYRDMFKLIFMLIGINCADLYGLKSITATGRIEYSRAKTHRLYSVKVEPEAMEIIQNYSGERALLNIADRWCDSSNFMKYENKALKTIGLMKREGRGGRKVITSYFPDITTYWARHSWATIAASLDIPKETIAHALGHGCNTVTDIYIDFDERKVDEANRRVLDWVLYGKK